MLNQFLIISELHHFLLTLGIAILLYWRFRDRRLILACFLFGFLIDVDHFFDYFAYFGLDFRSISSFLAGDSFIFSKKAYVPLHGWEYVILFWLVTRWFGRKFKIKGLEWAAPLSYLGHLLVDNFSFSHHPLAYFFTYRLINNFSLESFNGF